MGCFLACFNSVNEKRRKPRKKTTPPRERRHKKYESLQPSFAPPLEQPKTETEAAVNPPMELPKIGTDAAVNSLLDSSRDKKEDLSFNGRKKVSFDLNVRTYEAEISTNEVEVHSLETKQEGEKDEKSKKQGEVNHSPLSQDNSTNSNSGSFPSNHRYGCYAANSDEDEEYEDCDFNDDGDDEDESDDDDDEGMGDDEEDTFDSCSNMLLEKEGVSAADSQFEMNEVTDFLPICGYPDTKQSPLASNGNVRHRSQYLHPVLNPVENLSQWKAVKAKPTPLKHSQKENVNLEPAQHIPLSPEPTFKAPRYQRSVTSSPSFNSAKPSARQEIPVDTSLSNWLVPPETTLPVEPSITPPQSSENSQSQRLLRSPESYDDRPILGALTVDELRQSVTSSPRKSPSRSPDDIPIVGSVGSYWNDSNVVDSISSQRSGSGSQGLPNAISKYTEDKKVNWYNIPFEERLERALASGVPHGTLEM